ncbi:MAG: FAD-dependent oxidoreductase [Deltaproteobacteria bacterium]
MTSPLDVLVVGAGVSGLSCARATAASGRQVQLLDRARGVGGRCATHRLLGMPFDLGVAFLHGQDRDFLAAVRAASPRRVEGWPRIVEGTGRPCQPEAFRPGEERIALADGVTAFPKHLAEGLTLRTGARVERLDLSGAAPGVVLEGGDVIRARHVVLALAAEQVLRLLDGTDDLPRSVASVRALLDSGASEPSLSICAAYPEGTVPPAWDAWFPEGSRVLQYLGHESSKRFEPPFLGLVLQAQAAWSRAHLDDPEWPGALLSETGRLAGDWAARPTATHAHRWRFARTDLASELSGPVLVRLPSGGSLGICGDRFAPGGGVEAAWISGRELGRRLSAPEVA